MLLVLHRFQTGDPLRARTNMNMLAMHTNPVVVLLVLRRYWTADPSYARKFPLFISIDGDDQRTLLLATAMHQAAGVQIITRRCADVGLWAGVHTVCIVQMLKNI